MKPTLENWPSQEILPGSIKDFTLGGHRVIGPFPKISDTPLVLQRLPAQGLMFGINSSVIPYGKPGYLISDWLNAQILQLNWLAQSFSNGIRNLFLIGWVHKYCNLIGSIGWHRYKEVPIPNLQGAGLGVACLGWSNHHILYCTSFKLCKTWYPISSPILCTMCYDQPCFHFSGGLQWKERWLFRTWHFEWKNFIDGMFFQMFCT